MSKPAFTPGPWTPTARGRQTAIAGPAIEWLAVLPYAPDDRFGLVDSSEINANARLIAAAPEMYEALRRALPWLATCIDHRADEAFKLVEAALAKATGDKP